MAAQMVKSHPPTNQPPTNQRSHDVLPAVAPPAPPGTPSTLSRPRTPLDSLHHHSDAPPHWATNTQQLFKMQPSDLPNLAVTSALSYGPADAAGPVGIIRPSEQPVGRPALLHPPPPGANIHLSSRTVRAGCQVHPSTCADQSHLMRPASTPTLMSNHIRNDVLSSYIPPLASPLASPLLFGALLEVPPPSAQPSLASNSASTANPSNTGRSTQRGFPSSTRPISRALLPTANVPVSNAYSGGHGGSNSPPVTAPAAPGNRRFMQVSGHSGASRGGTREQKLRNTYLP